MNLRAFDSLFKLKRRQYRRDTFREHRLARARRAYHQDVMASARRYFYRPLGVQLSPHFSKVNRVLSQVLKHRRCIYPQWLGHRVAKASMPETAALSVLKSILALQVCRWI
jgi:hypothetical protein